MLFSAELSPRCRPDQIAAHSRTLEDCGFHRIWVRDMFVVPWELWTAATTVALSTERVRIGVDVTNPYTRSPVVTAHAAATVDNISGGRLDLGVGRGISEFLDDMLPRLPIQVLEDIGMEKEWVSREELLDSFAVCGPRGLIEKAKRLEGLGVSEIILEYFALEDLQDLRAIIKK